MNRIHDMGGREDNRPVPVSFLNNKKESLNSNHWTSRTLAITLAMGFLKAWNLDSSRYSRESLSRIDYLSSSYYRRWFLALEKMISNFKMLSPDNVKKFSNKALKSEDVSKVLKMGSPSVREKIEPPAFAIGEEILTKKDFGNIFVKGGHTRLPSYAMGKRGRVVLYHNAHVFPDSNAHFRGESPQHLYSIEFSSEDLWGGNPTNKNDTVTLDLWEPYMEKIYE